MAGPMTHVNYVAGDGTTYRLRQPQWVATLTGAAAATATSPLPRGFRVRRRYYRVTATGREASFVVAATNSPMWTDAVGTGIIVPVAGSATPTSNNATLSGRTDERMKAI